MRIKKICIKGWRSFDHIDGATLDELKHINLIIGRNNTGKSNLFKYFHFLKNETFSIDKRNRQYDLYHSIHSVTKEKDTWAFLKNDIASDISIDFTDTQWHDEIPNLHKDEHLIKLRVEHSIDNKNIRLSVINKSDNPLLENSTPNNPRVYVLEKGEYENYREDDHLSASDTRIYWTKFLDSLVFVDPVRHYGRKGMSDSPYYFEGDTIIEKLVNLYQGKYRQWIQCRNKILKWIDVILNEKIKEFNVDARQARFLLTRGGEDIEADLSNLGTGVSQVFMLLSFLYLNRDQAMNVFLEEPENNIHPEALVRLVSVLNKEFGNHTFFISTHSAALIDQVKEDWSIHYVKRTKDGPSLLQPCNEVIHYFSLLDDLGFRASQLVQSNLVIWVEGPSDRIYIKKWLEIKSNGEILENQHYSFLMYGGSNLSSYDLFENEENIGLLKTSRYVAIVCDSDKSKEENELKERVQKIYKVLGGSDDPTTTISEAQITDYALMWVTHGREIENYIPTKLLVEICGADKLRKQRLNRAGDEDGTSLVFKNDEAISKPIGLFDAFDKYLAKFFTDEKGNTISSDQQAKISTHYNQKKVDIAKEVALKWSEGDFDPSLEKAVSELMSLICKANNLRLSSS